MEEVKVFDSEEAMKAYIAEKENESAQYFGCDKFFDESEIFIKGAPVNDTRIGWEDTRYVCAKRYGREEGTYVLGMCATKFPGSED